MFEVGRVCVKIAGRDAGKTCVVVDTIDNNFVMIDGETRRRKCNVSHLEPLAKTVSIQKGASHDAVAGAMQKAGYNPRNTKAKKVADRPKKEKVVKKQAKPAKSDKKDAKAPKKAEKPTLETQAEVKDAPKAE